MPNDKDDDSKNSQDRYSLKDAAEVFGDFEASFDGFGQRRSRPPEGSRRPSQPQVSDAPAALEQPPVQQLRAGGTDLSPSASGPAQSDPKLLGSTRASAVSHTATEQVQAHTADPHPSASLNPDAAETRESLPGPDAQEASPLVPEAPHSRRAEPGFRESPPLPSQTRPTWQTPVAFTVVGLIVAGFAYKISSSEPEPPVAGQRAANHEPVPHDPFFRAIAELQEQLESGDCEAALATLRRHPKFWQRNFYAENMQRYVEACGPPPPIQVLSRAESALKAAASARTAEPAVKSEPAPPLDAQSSNDAEPKSPVVRTKKRRVSQQATAPGTPRPTPSIPSVVRTRALAPELGLAPTATPDSSSAQPALPARSPPWAKPQTEAAPKANPGDTPGAQESLE